MRVSKALFGVVVVLCLGCSHGAPPDPELIASLRSELASVEADIEQAEAENAKYSGGLLKSLIEVRLELLKTSQELIRQHIHALETGAPVTVTVPASEPDEELATKLEAEMKTQHTKLEEAEAYSAQYSGGLVKAMAESNVATASTTLAMLDQRRLIAKYGLGFPSLPSPNPAPEASAQSSAPPPQKQSKNLQDEIITIHLLSKRFAEQDLQDFIFFNIEFTAGGLDKPTRAVKGVLHLQDLFGEAKMNLRWTIEEPLAPNGSIVEQGTGFKYNQFNDAHQWVRATDLENMTATFTVESILYADGTRRDF